MRASTRRLIEGAIVKYGQSIAKSLSESAAVAYAAGSNHASGYVGKAGVGFGVIQSDAIKFADGYYKCLEKGVLPVYKSIDIGGGKTTYAEFSVPWLRDMEVKTRKSISDIVERGIKEGKPVGYRRNSNGKYPKGTIAGDISEMLDAEKHNAATFARTETARCYYRGEMERYAKSGVQFVEFSGGPDACDICEQYIGKTFSIGTQPPIPIHPNCRCDYIPVFPGDAGDSPMYAPSPTVPYTEPKPKPTTVKPSVSSPIIPQSLRGYTFGSERFNDYTRRLDNSVENIRIESEERNLVLDILEVDKFLSDKYFNGEINQNGSLLKVTEIYRGVKGEQAEKCMKLHVGDPMPDHGYQSWTIDKSVAESFNDYNSKNRVTLVMQVSDDINGFYIGDSSRYPEEKEVLRPRGLVDIVVSINDTPLSNGGIKRTIFLKQQVITP